MPLPLQQIGPVDPSRYRTDQHLPGARLWDRPGDNPQDLGSTGHGDVDDAHGRRKGGHGVFTSFAGERLRSEKGLKSVRVSRASTPSRRFSHATPAYVSGVASVS